MGAIIDQNLNWENHIFHIKKKVAKGLGIIGKSKQFLNIEALKTLYHSFIYPYLDYCIEVWGSASKTRIDTLFRMQKKAIRFITMSSYRAESSPLFKKLGLLTIYEIHLYKVALFMFKVHHEFAPQLFQEYYTSKSEIHNYETRGRTTLHVPDYDINIRKLSIRFKGVYVWNFVCKNVSPKCSLNIFKSGLRKLLTGNKQIFDIIP